MKKKALKGAWAILNRNVEAQRNLADETGWGQYIRMVAKEMAHKSHKICAANGGAIYCANCAAWSAKMKTTKKMEKSCTGEVRVGTRHDLRLLKAGITPHKGAKIPANARKRY